MDSLRAMDSVVATAALRVERRAFGATVSVVSFFAAAVAAAFGFASDFADDFATFFSGVFSFASVVTDRALE
jgi:hypothetical protein